MELLATRDEKQIWFHELARPYHLDPPFAGQMYVGVVFANDETITNVERNAMSDQLVQTNCRYAVCAGHKCATWDDSVDWAYLETVNYEPNDDAFVMTCWCEGDPVEEVIFIGLTLTNFDDHDFDRYLVLALGPRPGLREEVMRGIESVWECA